MRDSLTVGSYWEKMRKFAGEKFAVVSVSDKTNLLPFVKGLVELGVDILSTGGTAQTLFQAGVPVTLISDYTKSPEILDGRVKTLHPRIHAGILARRDRVEDQNELKQQDISPIDFVVVNLYPFLEKVEEVIRGKNSQHGSLVEYIDIGGPTMLRAAAKNCRFVVPVCDPQDYSLVLEELRKHGEVSLATRRSLASKVFAVLSSYDGAVARYFALNEQVLTDDGNPILLAPVESIVLRKEEELRYGENPHQVAAYYRNDAEKGERPWKQLQGKEISYNNLLDMEATLDLFLDLLPLVADTGQQEKRQQRPHQSVAVITKHTNPCGVALGKTSLEAFIQARACDPLSAFGGIIAVHGSVDQKLAATIVEGFVEVVLAGEITDDALAIFSKKKNVRVIRCDFSDQGRAFRRQQTVLRKAVDGYLLQQADYQLTTVSAGKVVTERKPTAELLGEAEFAWRISKHVKSNAIVLVNNFQAVGVGAGQMSRVDAAKLAISRSREHGHSIQGAVAASDAFLPFPDTLEILHDQGVQCLVQPGGSLKDDEVIAAANKRNMVMIFTDERHFRH